MLRVGLTGGIATGKSTVAAIFRGLGCRVLEADKAAHQLMQPGGAAYDKVIREFGRGILSSDGRVDRSKLGAIVFADAKRLEQLNAIIHPLVIEARDREMDLIGRAEPHAIVVAEAALLIEAGSYKKLDSLVVTWCTPEQQLARLMQRDAGRGLTPDQALKRIAAQMPSEEKRRLADEEIDCSGTLEHTREQVVALFAKLKRMETERFGNAVPGTEQKDSRAEGNRDD